MGPGGCTNFNDALAAALKSLRRTEMFSAQVRELLLRQGVPPEIADQVVSHLEQKRIVDDKRTVDLVVERSAGKKAKGPQRLREELERRGAPSALIERAIDSIGAANRMETMLSALKAQYPRGAPRARAGRFLFSRGFSEDDVEEALSRWGAT